MCNSLLCVCVCVYYDMHVYRMFVGGFDTFYVIAILGMGCFWARGRVCCAFVCAVRCYQYSVKNGFVQFVFL
jgi:hypothetical protein